MNLDVSKSSISRIEFHHHRHCRRRRRRRRRRHRATLSIIRHITSYIKKKFLQRFL